MKNTAKSPEEIREQYKKDKRKPMSVRAHTKLNAITALFAGLFCFYTVFSADVIGMQDQDHPADLAIFVVLMTGMFVSGFIWLMNLASYKMEPDDELSERIRGKANGISFVVWHIIVINLFFVAELVKKGAMSAMFRPGNFFMLFISGILTYDTARHFTFLILDRPEKSEDEEE